VASVKLRIGHADGRVEERELGPGSYRVGREDADIVLPHGSVSAHHAQLQVQAQRVLITDAGSRNGTLEPSGQRISTAYALVPDQPIRLGAITLTLLRSLGQAGGTRAMPEAPAPRGARVLEEVPPQLALPPLVSSELTRAPPPTSRWLKLLGVGIILLLGFASLKTCSALVQVLSGTALRADTPRKSAPSQAPSKRPPSKTR
jgi:pSer/pThr/pTyr-binding forkhead associated (FHA) protein